MFFYNKKRLREAGYDDAFIEAMPERTLAATSRWTRSSTSPSRSWTRPTPSTASCIGRTRARTTSWCSRPTATASSIRRPAIFCSSATSSPRPSAGSSAAVKEGVIPANNTAMEFDALRKEFYTGNAAFWMYGIWDLGSYAFPTYGLPNDEAGFFADWGWIAAPARGEGRSGEQPDASRSSTRSPPTRRIRSSPSGCSATPRPPTSTPITRSRRRISASSPSSSRIRATRRPGRSPGRRSCWRSPSSCPTTRSSAT